MPHCTTSVQSLHGLQLLLSRIRVLLSDLYDGSFPSSQLQGVTSAELTQSVRLSANGLLMALCSSMYHDRDVDVFIPRVVGGQKFEARLAR